MPQTDSPDMKKAASLLLKGGTLTSEQCKECGGIVVRFQGKSTCVECGHEVDTSDGGPGPSEALPESRSNNSSSLQSSSALASLVTDKLFHVAGELEDDNDIGSQQRKADLMETYLRILQLLKQ